jgi:predicted Zn-dependent protease
MHLKGSFALTLIFVVSHFMTFHIMMSRSYIVCLRLPMSCISLITLGLFLCLATSQADAYIDDQSDALQRPTLSSGQVIAGAEKMYRQRLSDIERAGYLDKDEVFLERTKKIAQVLIQQAAQDYPETRNWQWEIHSSSEQEETAYSMAGGKILLSQLQIERLSLNEAELAMLLSHEIAHTVLEHNRLEYEQALVLFPAWHQRSFEELEDAVDNDESFLRALAPLCKQQEEEADAAGLKLAQRAGFPLSSLVNFYRKLSRTSSNPNFDSKSHPAPARRWMAMRELALALSKDNGT